MPVFAGLIGTIATFFVSLLGKFIAFDLAIKYAAYITWGVVMTAFLAAVFTCTSGLYSALTSMLGQSGGVNGGLMSSLSMGVGMLIPANAGAVIGCVSSVWMATNIYKIQKQGIFNFSK